MWKTQHVAVIAVVATILSVAVTLYAQSRINAAITARAAQLNGAPGTPNTNPIQLMSALSAKKKKTLAETLADDLMPEEIPKTVRFEEPSERPPPKGAGSRWTPL